MMNGVRGTSFFLDRTKDSFCAKRMVILAGGYSPFSDALLIVPNFSVFTADIVDVVGPCAEGLMGMRH